MVCLKRLALLFLSGGLLAKQTKGKNVAITENATKTSIDAGRAFSDRSNDQSSLTEAKDNLKFVASASAIPTTPQQPETNHSHSNTTTLFLKAHVSSSDSTRTFFLHLNLSLYLYLTFSQINSPRHSDANSTQPASVAPPTAHKSPTIHPTNSYTIPRTPSTTLGAPNHLLTIPSCPRPQRIDFLLQQPQVPLRLNPQQRH